MFNKQIGLSSHVGQRAKRVSNFANKCWTAHKSPSKCPFRTLLPVVKFSCDRWWGYVHSCSTTHAFFCFPPHPLMRNRYSGQVGYETLELELSYGSYEPGCSWCSSDAIEVPEPCSVFFFFLLFYLFEFWEGDEEKSWKTFWKIQGPERVEDRRRWAPWLAEVENVATAIPIHQSPFERSHSSN